MEEINKKGFTKENLKKLFSFDKDDVVWIFFMILLFLAVYGYIHDTKACRETLSNPDYQKCALYVRTTQLAKSLKEKYPGVTVSCYPETGRCEVSGVARMPGMPTKEDIEALNLSEIIFNISE